MGLDSRPAQIVAVAMLVVALFCSSWLTVWGQDKLTNVPIISDVKVDSSKDLRIVTRDEIQRISDDSVLRVQKMEKDIRILKSQITHLQSQIAELEKQIGG